MPASIRRVMVRRSSAASSGRSPPQCPAVQHFRGLVQVTVLQDVHLDAGQERGSLRRSPLSSANHVELFGKPFDAQPVGDGEVGGWPSGRGTPGPASCGVGHEGWIGDPPSDQSLWLWRSPRREEWSSAPPWPGVPPALAQVLQVVGYLAVDRLPDDFVRSVADPLHAFEPAVPWPGFDLVGVQCADDPAAFRNAWILKVGHVAFQPERDLIERIDGIHLSILHPPCAHLSYEAVGRFWISRERPL